MKKIDMIVDLQFGSTGKGLYAGFLAYNNNPDTLVTAWAPNAGHTYRDKAFGLNIVTTAVPNGVISARLRQIMLGPGSVINIPRLEKELDDLDSVIGHRAKVLIHGNAAIVFEKHRRAEAEYGFKIGSTMKGVGAAVIEKIRRDPIDMIVARDCRALFTNPRIEVIDHREWLGHLMMAETIQVEGAQGYSLGINSGFYPYTTSRECTVAQLISDCAIPAEWVLDRHHNDVTIHGVMRTYPIRVSNRFDASGALIGTSGPCYEDQVEISWGDIYLEPELTTVTKLPRRIFTFSAQQVYQAVLMNGCDKLFLNFCNYDQSANIRHISQFLEEDVHSWTDLLESIEESLGRVIHYLGWGPDREDIEKVR